MKKIALVILVSVFCNGALAFALPQGQSVESGSASFSQPDANTLNITANDKAVINFITFNIGQRETVNFIQPNANASVLSRVLGNIPSSILGNLFANGVLFLINTHGIYFGPTANVNVNTLVASTLDISTNNFINQRYIFEHDPQKIYAEILNKGTIVANNLALIASAVENKGIIIARAGSVNLASGDKTTVSFDRRGLIQVEINEQTSGQVLSLEDGKPLKDAVSNSGSIEAKTVVMSAKTASDIFEYAVNQTGVVRGTGMVEENGTIRIVANKQVQVSGTLEAPQGNIKVESTESSINITSEGSLIAADTIELLAHGAVSSLGFLKADRLIEKGASFLLGGTSEVDSAYMVNDDHAVTYNTGNFSGTYTDADNIIINDNAIITLTGNTIFWADYDNSGVGAFVMNVGSSIAGGGYNLTIYASQGSNLRSIAGVGNLTLRASKTGSNPTYTANSVLSVNNTATITSCVLFLNSYDFIVNSIINNGIIRGANYYVDATGGNDTNPGTWQGKTWKTIAKVNAAPLQPGDSVLFKRGETWREQLILTSGDATGFITYGAYGTGNKPLLLGSKLENQLTDWTNEGGNIWSDNDASFTVDIGNIIFNNEVIFGLKKSAKTSLVSQGDFFYDPATHKLYLYSTSNPASFYTTIECALNDASNQYIIALANYNIVENFDLRYAGSIAINGGDVDHVIVRNNDISFIGGGYLYGTTRYGNGIQFYNSATNILVEKNIIHDIFDTPITNQGDAANTTVSNVIWRNNVCYNFGLYGFEYHMSGLGGSVNGLYVENNTFAGLMDGWVKTQGRTDGWTGIIGLFNNHSSIANFMIRNNILFSNTAVTDISSGRVARSLFIGGAYFDNLANVTIDYNDYYRASGQMIYYMGSTYTLAQFATYQSAKGKDIHSIAADPLLNPDYTLKSNSPCISKGLAGVDIGATPYQSVSASAPAIYTFTGTGNWSDPSLWSLGAVPGLNDLVTIDGICSLTTNALGLGSVTINLGKSLNLAGYNISTTNGIINNGTLYLLGNESITGGLTNTASSTVEYSGTGSYSGLAAGNNYYRLNLNGAGSWTLANPLNVNGNLTITGGNTLNANAKAITIAGNWTNNGTFNNNSGTVTLNGAALQQVKTGGAASAFYVLTITNTSASGVAFIDALYTATLNATAGVRKLSFAAGAGIVHTISSSFNVAGSGGNLLELAPLTAGQVWYLNTPNSTVSYINASYSSQAAGKIITAANSTNGGNNTNWNFGNSIFTFTGTGNWSDITLWSMGALPGANATVIIDGTCNLTAYVLGLNLLTINTGKSLNLAGYNISTTNGIINNGTLYLLGNESITGGLTNAALSTVMYKGTGSYSGLAAGNNYYNLTFNGTGAWTLVNPLNVNGNLTIASGTLKANGKTMTLAGNLSNSGTFSHGNNTVIFNGATGITGTKTTSFYNVVINAGKTMTTPGSGNIYVAGNWTNNGTFNNNSGTVTLNGATLQQVKTGGLASAFYVLTITNTSTSGVAFIDALYTATLNATAGVRKLSFATGAGIVHTITTKFNISGRKNNLLQLAPLTTGQVWYLNAPSSTISYVSVSYSSETAGKIITAANSINGGYNTNWIINKR